MRASVNACYPDSLPSLALYLFALSQIALSLRMLRLGLSIQLSNDRCEVCFLIYAYIKGFYMEPAALWDCVAVEAEKGPVSLLLA